MTAEAAKPKEEFREIAHSGGTITIRILTRPEGRAYSIEFRHCRPVASSFYSIHVLQPGIAIATAVLGGMGSPHDPGPVPGCFQVYIFSDSEGMYGRQCRACNRYWRSRSPSAFCAYCGWSGAPHEFLTDAQARYVQQYSAAFQDALSHEEDGEYVIDLDAVADAVGSEEKPPFYYAEESQQNRFTCSECDSHEDILGRFGYCSVVCIRARPLFSRDGLRDEVGSCGMRELLLVVVGARRKRKAWCGILNRAGWRGRRFARLGE